MPTAYQMFIKENIGKFKHLPPKDRIRACAKMYREMQGKKMPAKKNEKGGSFLGSLIPFGSLLGLGLDTKKKRKSPMRKAKGGNLVTPTLNSSGGGLDDIALGFLEHVAPFAHLLL